MIMTSPLSGRKRKEGKRKTMGWNIQVGGTIRSLTWGYAFSSCLLWLGPRADRSNSRPEAPAVQTERHLTNIRQLTFSGKMRRPTFHPAGINWSFSPPWNPTAKPAWMLPDLYHESGRANVYRVSTGTRNHLRLFFPGDRRVLFSSTHINSTLCPPEPPRGERYRWALDDYDLFTMSLKGWICNVSPPPPAMMPKPPSPQTAEPSCGPRCGMEIWISIP